MKNKNQSSLRSNVRSGSIFSTLLVVFAALLGGGERGAAQLFPGQGDDTTSSMGVFRITVDPAFRTLVNSNGALVAYTGYRHSSGKLTSPLCVDNATTIGRTAPHTRPYIFPVPLGAGSWDSISGYGDYAAIPSLWAGALPPTEEVLTEIRNFVLLSVSGGPAGQHCPPDPRIPDVPLNWPMVKAGPDAGVTPRSLGMVHEDVVNGPANPDFPAHSFFDIFVEVNLPPLPGTLSGTAFPVTGAVLYNDSPLIITNLNLTSFPPTVIYIHGETPAVPLKFRFTNPPYWTAGDIFGYLVLAGHGTISDECTNTAAVNALLDAALGPIGTSAPEMPVEWLRTNTLCPSPGSTYDSVEGTNSDGTSIDAVSFPVPGFGIIQARHFSHGNFPNPINPPPPNGTAFYNEPNTEVTLEISPGGNSWLPAQGQGPTQVQIHHNPGTGTSVFDTEMLQLNLTGNSPFGPFMIRESPTRQSSGRHTIRTDPRGFRISSFFDVFLELSLDGGASWNPADRSIRVQPSSPPAAPNSIFVSTDGGQLILNWLGSFTLQSATNVMGPYTDVPGPIFMGPYSTPMSESQKYFRLRGGAPETTFFDTEMLQLDIMGGSLPPGMLIRESPTRASLGKTTIAPVSGGGYAIDSFFDVFTELSMDGGMTWQVSTSAPPRMSFKGTASSNTLPPPNSAYVSPADWHAAYAQGIYITNASHFDFTGSFPPPPPGTGNIHSFGSMVNMEMKPCEVCPPQPISAPAQVAVEVISSP